ncbi:MAG: rod shape-determining protein MreC [Phascolarctobacterium sp.]|nr:rod shape-determining protein MreC [Phascolarctobacterium sp.]
MSKKGMLCALFVLVLFSMLALAVSGKSRFPLINKAVATVVLPIENALVAIGNTGDDIRGYWRALTVLQSENKELKQENVELRNANVAMAAIYAENKQLRELLNYKEQHRTQTTCAAKVIARNFGDLRDSMYINIGKDAGLKREMAVLNGSGLIGVIDEVYDDYAKVLLITSARCKVGARILRTDSRAIGVVNGRSSSRGMLVMEHIFREADVKKGDVVVTSGYSGSHPENILIGTVTDVRLSNVGLLQEADVAPAADVADVEHVLVITHFTPEQKVDMNLQGGQAK